MSKLLLEESPLVVLPSLATAIGLNEAIALQQVHYWLVYYRKSKKQKHFHDGRWWVWNSARQWKEDNFPFWSEVTIRRTLGSLRKGYEPRDKKRGRNGTEPDSKVRRGPLLITANHNKKQYDRTLWYTIDYDELAHIESLLPDPCDQSDQMACDQSDQIEEIRVSEPIPETNTETTSETSPENSAAPAGAENPPAAEQDGDVNGLGSQPESPEPQTPSEPEPQEIEQSPGKAYQARLRARYGGATDPLGLASTLQQRQIAAGGIGDGKSFTVPPEAGGADPFADGPLSAFCTLIRVDPDALGAKDTKNWARKLREIAEHHQITAAEMELCIGAIPKTDDYAWRAGGFTNPYETGFQNVVNAIILRHLSGTLSTTETTDSSGHGRRGNNDQRQQEGAPTNGRTTRRWELDVG